MVMSADIRPTSMCARRNSAASSRGGCFRSASSPPQRRKMPCQIEEVVSYTFSF